jgi:hypothetical protein
VFLKIDLPAKSNGVVFGIGDTSHPNSVEIVAVYPDWAKRNELILKRIRDLLRGGSYEKDYLKKLVYVSWGI